MWSTHILVAGSTGKPYSIETPATVSAVSGKCVQLAERVGE
jgi:hypothetical protein